MDSDGRTVPVGPEFLQRYDEAVKQFSENKNQNKVRAAPRGGVRVSASRACCARCANCRFGHVSKSNLENLLHILTLAFGFDFYFLNHCN